MSIVAVVGDATTTTTLALAAAWRGRLADATGGRHRRRELRTADSGQTGRKQRRVRAGGARGSGTAESVAPDSAAAERAVPELAFPEPREPDRAAGDVAASEPGTADPGAVAPAPAAVVAAEIDDVLVLEADPTGGSMAAWLDIPVSPSLSTVVTRAGAGGWPAIDALARETASGLRLVPAPVRSLEAVRAVAEAERHVFGVLAGLDRPVVVVDAGDVLPALGAPAVLRHADVAVVVHRQARQSARAAAVRLERLAELVDVVVSADVPMILAVIGATPFEPAEIARFVAGADRDAEEDAASAAEAIPPVVGIADDPLSAAVIAGRTGVSARRFARLPLARSAAELAGATAAVLESVRSTSAWRSRL